MGYVCDLSPNQRVYLENQGVQTSVTVVSSSPGQQQQASNQFQTGAWIAPPELYQTPAGYVIRLLTSGGDRFIQVQGRSMSVMGAFSGLGSAPAMQMQQATAPVSAEMTPMQPMPSMQPMQPMQPMTLGDMQMNTNPMQMRMGNMEMQMGNRPTVSPAASSTDTPMRRFCSQCGAAVSPSDRFCSSCGHQLAATPA